MPRPPSGITTGRPPAGCTVRKPAAPPPWPTTLIAIVAIPWAANVEATANGAPCLLSVKPCPKIATGQPSAGAVPEGMNRLKKSSLIRCTTGTPVRVPIGGMNFSGVSQSGDAKLPKAIALTEPGKTESAGSGRNDTVKLGAVPVWRDHWIAVRLASGNVPLIVAGRG